MQYRHKIGHALANFAFAADTKRKTSVPLFFASTGGLRLPSFMPILHKSLQFIDCYSPQLHRFSASNGLGLPFYRPIIHHRFILLVSTVLRFASLQVSGSGCPLSKAYRVNIAPYYLFTLKNTFHYRKLYDIRVFV